MKKYFKNRVMIIFIIAVIFIFCLGIYVYNRVDRYNMRRFTEYDKIELSYEEAVSAATHIVEAEFLGEYKTEAGTELMFKPIEVIKGSLEDEDSTLIYIQSMNNGASAEKEQVSSSFIKGNEYMLLLEKNVSVYYEHNKYVLIGEGIVSKKSDMWEAYKTRAKELAKASKTQASYGVAYSSSADINELVDFSSNIFVVDILDVFAESSIAPTTVYNCRVTKVYRGEPAEGGNILITLFDGTVEIGEAYLVLLADASETAPVYTLSGKDNCVYSVEDAGNILELKVILEGASDYAASDTTKSYQEILDEELEAKEVN